MAKKKKLTKKEYIDIKIANCDKLIANPNNSLAQKEIYAKYRKDWIDKLSPSQNPEIIAAKVEKKRIADTAKAIRNAEIEATKAEVDRIKAEKEAKLEETLKQIKALKLLLPKEVTEPESEPASEDPIND